YHQFYVKWLDLFPAAVTSVPWQSYPGHVPCPLPIPPGLHYQWQAARMKAWHGPRKQALLRRAGEMLAAQRFPRDLLSKSVARLLAPTDYGVVGMAMIYLGFMQLVNEFGLGSAIIQRRDLTADQISRLNGLALLLGWAFVALSAVLAWPVAVFFGEAAVRWIILASSITFLMTALQI